MITDADIKKMKKVFVTKDDLKNELKKFVTKDDLKDELKGFATKEDLRKSTDELVDLITVGFGRVDKALERLEEHDDILDNHEHRLDKLEDEIFA